MAKDLFCDECGELIQGDVYYIGKTKPALVLHNPIFCSDECVLDYLQVDSFPAENFDE